MCKFIASISIPVYFIVPVYVQTSVAGARKMLVVKYSEN